MFMPVRRAVSRTTTHRKRNVPVSATKYIKPSYNNLWSRIRHITTITRKMTYIFMSLEALQRVSADAIHQKKHILRRG